MGKDKVYLKHILDAITVIEDYTKGIDVDRFQAYENKLIQDGVIREFEIIGEAVKNLSDDLKRSYSGTPWRDIAGMRDKLIHIYFGVDLEAVWQTVRGDLPKLKSQIKEIMPQLEG